VTNPTLTPEYRLEPYPRDAAGRFLSGEQHWLWKGDQASDHAKRLRARRWYALPSACEACGRSDRKIERHHADGNPGNNDPANIWFVCRSCHQRIDGRAALAAARLAAANPVHEPTPCSNCGRIYKPLRGGRCPTCARCWKQHGTEFDPANVRKRELVGPALWDSADMVGG
jgi:predicted Zn-ribbon and HTH transcriptional regulator